MWISRLPPSYINEQTISYAVFWVCVCGGSALCPGVCECVSVKISCSKQSVRQVFKKYVALYEILVVGGI